MEAVIQWGHTGSWLASSPYAALETVLTRIVMQPENLGRSLKSGGPHWTSCIQKENTLLMGTFFGVFS